MSLSPASCSSVPLVHSGRLEELIGGLTALVQYTVQLLRGSHTAQPQHSAIRPLSVSPSLSPLLSLPSGWLRFSHLFRFIIPLPGYIVIHLWEFSSCYLPHPPVSMSTPETHSSRFHPFLSRFWALSSDEGVRSGVINKTELNLCVCVTKLLTHLVFSINSIITPFPCGHSEP